MFSGDDFLNEDNRKALKEYNSKDWKRRNNPYGYPATLIVQR